MSYQPRSYTAARRYPAVIANIEGVPLIWPMTPTQLGVLAGTFLVLLWTRAVWAYFGQANLLVLLGLPLGAAWAARHVRPQGRSPLAAAAGLLSLALAPRGGVAGGRRLPASRVVHQRAVRGFVEG